MAGGLLAIFAHPDDETFGVGGTMAHYRDRGVPVTMVCATRGEVGEIAPGTDATPETLGRFREQELRDACAILGVSDVRFLDFRDSGMAGTPENDDPRCLHRAEPERVIEPLVHVIREVRPDVIATWDASGGYGHPDHIAVHHHATAAFHAAADAARYPSAGDGWRVPALFYNAIPVEEFMNLFEEARKRGIDIGEPPGDADAMASLPRVRPNCIIDVASSTSASAAPCARIARRCRTPAFSSGCPRTSSPACWGASTSTAPTLNCKMARCCTTCSKT